MKEPRAENQNETGREQDFSEFARARDPVEHPRSGFGSFLRGCGIALGIAFLVFAFVVGACFIKMS